jgi:hypothetical protein
MSRSDTGGLVARAIGCGVVEPRPSFFTSSPRVCHRAGARTRKLSITAVINQVHLRDGHVV